MRKYVYRVVASLTILSIISILNGCGSKPTFDVTGTVTYNGSPLDKPDGKIIFLGDDGTEVITPIGLDGTYKALKVAGGHNRIVINYKNPAFTMISRPKGGILDPKHKPVSAGSPSLIPDKYTKAETSGFSVEVKAGTVYNVEMTGPKIQ